MIVRRDQNPEASALFRHAILENMTLDWTCDHPNEPVQTDSEPMFEESDNPDVNYIFHLCSSIHEKLDLLQQAAGREELGEYAESHLKTIITELLEIETKIDCQTSNLNVISDTLNNLARNSTDGQPCMINGLISL